MTHSFDVKVAKKYGVDEAIILNNLFFWIQKNAANKRHFHDGRYWTYNSIEAFSLLFPYWSKDHIRRLLKKMEDNGLIITGNFNSLSFDRTCWYAICDSAYSILQNCNFHLAEVQNGVGKSAEPIPDSKPDNKPDKEESREKAEDKSSGTPYSSIQCLYSSICKSYSKLTKLSDARKKAIHARFAAGYKLEDFKRLFEMAEASSFLKGANNRNWQATFDWLIKDANMAKVLDGNYADKATPTAPDDNWGGIPKL